MVQNRNKLIDLFVGNISNSIIHEMLEKAIDNEFLSKRYEKELTTSLEIAKRYREKINPVNSSLSNKDVEYIKNKIKNKVISELSIRISNGYKNIDLELANNIIEKYLKEVDII